MLPWIFWRRSLESVQVFVRPPGTLTSSDVNCFTDDLRSATTVACENSCTPGCVGECVLGANDAWDLNAGLGALISGMGSSPSPASATGA